MLGKLLSKLVGPSTAATSMSGGAVPNPAPSYVYKILETATTNPRYQFPVPIPA